MLEQPADEPRYTYGDYLLWQGDDRWELIDGVPFDMSPAPGCWHQAVVGHLFRQISGFFEGKKCYAYVAAFDIRLPVADKADESVVDVVQPDTSVIYVRSKPDDADCRGAPDWVIEVLSPRTAARDRSRKRDLYERSGVREYWVVDPVERTLTVFVSDSVTGGFAPPHLGPDRDIVAPQLFPHLLIDWDRVFAD